ncbi:unnamed protein product [Prunus armeniaca]
MPKHTALRHTSFVLPSAPPCLAISSCDMQVLCHLRHPRAYALRHAILMPSVPSCPATSPYDMQLYVFGTLVPSSLPSKCPSYPGTWGTMGNALYNLEDELWCCSTSALYSLEEELWCCSTSALKITSLQSRSTFLLANLENYC